MARYQVKEDARYLGETWGGYFTGVTEDYTWARKQMEYRFLKYVSKYKSSKPRISMGRTACKLTFDGADDYIEVTIENLDKEDARHE